MNLVLPNATELRKLSEEAREAQHREWIESIKQTVIDDAKSGSQISIIEDPYCCKYKSEIANIFEPLGYEVSFTRHDGSDLSTKYYIKIMW